MKKLLAVMMAAIIILSVCGCSSSEIGETANTPVDGAVKYNITLAYCANDYINPYTCVTKVNANLSTLIYEPLVGVDENYKPVNVLASDINYEDGKILVRLKEHVVFSDGTPFTAEDVKYSFLLAKSSESVFAEYLASVKSCEITDSLNLVFSLDSKDIFAENLLTFPIIKKDSDNLESSDSVLFDPIGTGRYVLSDNKLLENKNYRDSDTKLKEINLINTPDNEALLHSVSAGRISVFYSDLSDGEIPKMMCKSMTVSGTNLVYIGFNNISAARVSSDIRQIISEVIDREKMCELAYINYAEPATGLYPDNLKETEGLQTIESKANLNNVLAKLTNMGYNVKDNNGYLCDKNGNVISVSILVNEESRAKCVIAEHLVAQLSQVGIKATVTYRSFEEYISALKNGNYQLYIGEIKFKDNLDVSSLLVSGGSAAYGVAPSDSLTDNSQGAIFGGNTQDRVKEFYRGEAMFSDILIYFMSELPVIPVCYRCGWLGYDASLLDNVLKPWVSDAYNGIWLFG